MLISKKTNSEKAKLPFFQKFRRDKKGATAVEFAILGLPFMALLFGIIEISVVFIITTNTEHALSEVSREIRTGEFQTSGGDNAGALKTAVCNAMSGLGNCNKLRVDVVKAATGKFSELKLPVSPPDCSTDPDPAACLAGQPAMPADEYVTTGSEDVVIVRVQYVHQLTIPTTITGLSNASGNTRVITATTAFRNEPF